MVYSLSDDMEYEYTNPPTVYSFTPIEEEIENAVVMEEPENDSNENTQSVCNLLDHVTLKDTNEIEEPEHSSEQEEQPEKNEEAVVLYRSPSPPFNRPAKEYFREEDSYKEDPYEEYPIQHHENTATEHEVSPSYPHPSYPSNTFIYQQADPISHSHSTIYYLSGIVRISISVITFITAMYIFIQFILYMQHDIAAKIANYESDILEDHLYCQQQYELNRCAPDTRLPAISSLCREWEKCIYRPLSTTKTKILAEILAEIANAFLETLTIKTTIFMLVVVMGLLWASTHILGPHSATQDYKPPIHKKVNRPNILHYEPS